MEINPRKGEIDLLEAAVKLVRFLIKNLVWVILFPIAGAVAAFAIKSAQKPVYESQLVLRGMMYSEDEMSYLLSNYQKSGIPGLTEDEQSRFVRDFKFRVYSKETSIYAAINTLVTDTTILKKMQSGIVNQINAEDISQSYLETNRNYSSRMIQEYKDKIQMAEALVKTRKEGLGMIEILSLYSKLSEYETSYNLKTLIKVVSRFKPSPMSTDKVTSTIKGFTLGVLLLVIFLGVRSFVVYYQKTSNQVV